MYQSARIRRVGGGDALPATCARKLKVLADSTRLAVVERLMRRPSPVGEIARALDVEQSLLSHHLRTLREAGLVEARREGRVVIYTLAKGVDAGGTGSAIDLGCCRLSFPGGAGS